jgi:hypothetical protein
VIGRWTSDPSREDELERRLHEVILPLVTARPGFVAGYWTRDPETGRGHTTTVWDTVENARGFKAELDGDRRRAAELGLVNDFLIVTDVLAHARR